MTTLQRQLAFFGGAALTLLVLLWVFNWSWQGLLVLLVLLLVVIGAYLKPIYDLVVHPPVSVPDVPFSMQSEEVPSYEQGYQEVVYYTPSSPSDLALPKEEPVTEEVPMAQYQYPEMTQQQF